MRVTLFILSCLYFSSLSAKAQPDTLQAHYRIAFGSCNNQRQPQPLWPSVVAAKPDVWVWLGDNIYADTRDMRKLAKRYQQQLNHPGYQALYQSTPVTGTWDDHDYGFNNAGKSFKKKQQSQQLFLDFLGVSETAPVRGQAGIYRSYTLGEGDAKVKIILLDLRYHRDKLNKLFGLFMPNWAGDMLGEAQWNWLKSELTNSDAAAHVIVSSIQVLPTTKAYTNWSAFPAARERLLLLLEQTQPANPIILSGDRHVGEIGRIDLREYSQPIYEVTSSGMTHFRSPKKRGNPYRIGEQVGALNFGLLDIYLLTGTTKFDIEIVGVDSKVLLQQEVSYTSGTAPQQ